MRDVNPIRTLGDYSKPSHEGYRNTIEHLEGNNVVPLRSDTIRNWLERLPAGSISIWEDLTTRFLTQFFSLVRTAKLLNDILMYQQHQEESLSEALTRFKDLLQKVPHYGIDLWLKVQIFYDHVNPVTRRSIDQSTGGKLRNKNAKESWPLLEDLALHDNESWNDLRDFAKPVKAISLPQDVPCTSDRRLIELENQVQCLMESHLAPRQPTQVNKIISSCEICSGPHDTQYCMENPEQAFVEYTSSLTDETRRSPAAQMNFTSTNYPIKEELRGKGIKSTSKLLSPKYLSQSSLAEQNRNPSLSKRVHFVNSIVILNKDDEAKEEGNVKFSTTEYEDHETTVESDEEFEEETEEEIKEEEEDSPKHFDSFPTMKELRLHYNWIMSKRLGPRRKPSNLGKIYNFIGRVKGLKVFVGSFTYECDFMVLEDTTSVIDHDLGSVVFGKPSVEATGLVYYWEEGTITFEKDKEKIVFKIPHKLEWKFLIKNEEEIFTVRGDGVGIKPDGVASPAMLYLTIRSLEVLRKFHWTTLGGRSNFLALGWNLEEIHVTWVIWRRNGQDCDSTPKIMKNCVHTEPGDGVGVRDPVTSSGRGRLKEDLESSMWRRRHDFKATPSRRFHYI
ncbi:MAK10-like protein [Tanacetum coccineum]|uniref:MAK10-like protein n=1 Tax=Tanacetum coccineum TaxID=301880 RepID=A0ABQ5I136_9ASTR